jgi:RimJ/RimL family protein N-acetyltransferase
MFAGQKVRLREYRQDDVKPALNYINDADVKRLLLPGIPYPNTLQDEQKWVDSQTASRDDYNFAIETLQGGKYIGGCGINNIDWKNSVAVVGILIGDKNYWGQGYGTDAMKVLIKFIFNQMNIHKIKLHVYSFNTRAIKCYEKCGFKTEGILRKEIFRDGEYYDEHIMSILREEFYTADDSQ